MEEFRLLRPTIRSNAVTRSTSRAFAVNSSITTSRDTHSHTQAQVAARSPRHVHTTRAEINTTRDR